MAATKITTPDKSVNSREFTVANYNSLKKAINNNADILDTTTTQLSLFPETYVKKTEVKTLNGKSLLGTGDLNLIDIFEAGTNITLTYNETTKKITISASGEPDPDPEPIGFTDKFTFSLDAPRTTSAGIYDNDGVLVRTLWSAVPFEAGTHVEIWDGKDDLGNTLTGEFEPRVLDHNIEYEWAGVWGNTSDNQTGDDIHKPLDPIIGVRIMQHPNGRWMMMYISGYGEGGAAEAFCYLDDVQKRFNPIVIHGTNQNTDYIAFNSTKIFRAGGDPVDSESETFVYATDKSSENILTFEYGVKAKMEWGIEYQSVIGYMKQPTKGSTDISGIAANDNYIYLCRKKLNKISVINANTGQLLQDITVTTPCSPCIIGTNLWYGTGTSVVKRPINSDGSLGTISLTLTGFQSILDINYHDTNVTVVDGGNAQQIKTFNINNGASVWTRGQIKGFKGTGNKEVFNDKWLFNKPSNNGDGLTVEFSSIAYAPDGSYWLCDPANTRVQHFSANGTFIEQIAHEVRNYDVKINKNQNKLILSTYKVFEIDPTKPVKQGWKLKYNFQDDNNLEKVSSFTTLSNGRMYGTRISRPNGGIAVNVVELDPQIGVRETKATIGFGTYKMYEDGSVKWTVDVNDGTPRGKQQFWKKELIGFDSDNDPIWGADIKEEEIAIGVADPKASAPFSVDNSYRTENGNMISYEAGISDLDAPNQFRLGGHKNGKFMWRSLRTVEANHRGDFPLNGEFDWANYQRLPDGRPAAGYYGTRTATYGRFITASAHGEFWRGGQLNEHVIYDQDGLLIGVTGTQKPGGDPRKAEPFMAGNAITPNLFYYEEDDTLNIIHGDESVHQGIHRIKIKNPNSVRIQTGVPTNLPVLSLSGLDLLEGFKRGDVVTGNTNGWTIPTPHYNNDDDRFVVRVGAMTTDRYRLAGADLRFDFVMPSGSSRIITRDLGNNSNLNSWNIKGQIEFLNNERNDPTNVAGHSVEVLDAAGLVIAEFYYKRDNPFGRTKFLCNDVVMKDVNEESSDPALAYQSTLEMQNVIHYNNFEIGSSGSGIVFKYADFPNVTAPLKNTSANWRNPKTLRIRFYTVGNIYTRAVSFYKLRFFNT